MTHPLSEAGTSVEVKPLEWVKSEDVDTWHAVSVVGGYRVDGAFTAMTVNGPRTVLPQWRVYGEGPRECASVDEAKAGAQADYAQRIRSALIQPTPAETEGVAVPRELVEEASDLLRLYGDRNSAWTALADRFAALLASPTPPPIGDGEGDLVADLRRLAAATRDCSVCDGDGIKDNGNECGGCEGTGKVPAWWGAHKTMAAAADALAASEAQVSTLSRQLEEAREALEPDRLITVYDWAWTDEGGIQNYARTPERAELIKAAGYKLTPVYTIESRRELGIAPAVPRRP